MMKNNIFTFLFLTIALLVQIFFNDYIGVFNAKPDLVLIVLLISVLYVSPIYLVFLAFLFGLMQDLLLLTSLIGLSPLLKILFVYFAVKSVKFFKTFPNIVLYVVDLLLLFLYFVLYNFISLLRVNVKFSSVLLNYCLPEFLYTTILFVAFCSFIFYYKKNRE